MECRLVLVTSLSTDEYALKEGTTTVGRDSDNDIQLTSQSISRHHARFTNLTSSCEVEDLNSSNGTFIGTNRITKYQLRNGDEVRMGDCTMRFEETASIGADGLVGPQHDYSTRVREETVKLKVAPEGKPQGKPRLVMKPLKPKGQGATVIAGPTKSG